MTTPCLCSFEILYPWRYFCHIPYTTEIGANNKAFFFEFTSHFHLGSTVRARKKNGFKIEHVRVRRVHIHADPHALRKDSERVTICVFVQ